MPTVGPIYGADEAPMIETAFAAAEGSLDVQGTGASSYVDETISITGGLLFGATESIDVKNLTRIQSNSNVDIGVGFVSNSNKAIEIATGEGFMILADLIQEELAGDNTNQISKYVTPSVVLKINGVSDPENYKIKSFQLNYPTGRLGSILNVRLAKPNVNLIPAGATIDLSLNITINGVTTPIVLMKGGKLQERENQIAMAGDRGPADEVSFGAIDIIADKFSLGPRKPVVMFDPTRIRYDNVQTRNDQLMRDENRGLIQPRIEPVAGLSMRQILDRAYTGHGGNLYLIEVIPHGPSHSSFTWPSLIGNAGDDQVGCGFDKVITNIPDYFVRRADFTIEGGWHEGAQPVVAMFAPVYFVHENTLFILDVERPLPSGMSAHTIPISTHKSLSERIEYKPETNAIILTYQYNANDPLEDPQKVHQDVFKDEVVDITGVPGEAGYSKTTVRRWDRQFFLSDSPDNILDTLPISASTETEQTVGWFGEDGIIHFSGVKVTHQEDVDYLYDGDLKIRHEKVIKAVCADPHDDFRLQLRTVSIETCETTWIEDTNNPGLKLQSRVITDIREVCTYDRETLERINDPELGGEVSFRRLIPVLQAQASGLIASTWQLTELLTTKTIRETLQNMKGNAYDVEVLEMDYLNNTLKRSYTQPVTGTVQNDPYEAKSRTVLIRDTTSEGLIGNRVPLQVNAYELPREPALALGHRALKRLKKPLQTLPIQLPAVDFAISRGSVVQGQKRSGGITSKYFVTGYTITGENLGQQGHKISQSIEAVEIGTIT